MIMIHVYFHAISHNPLQVHTGAITTFVGVAGVLVSYHNYFTTPQGVLMAKGLYRISRNPIYVFILLICIGISALCSIYEMILMLVLCVILQHSIFKDEYKSYFIRQRGIYSYEWYK